LLVRQNFPASEFYIIPEPDTLGGMVNELCATFEENCGLADEVGVDLERGEG
jgi:hypothetical protein